jgi:antitoxin HicB
VSALSYPARFKKDRSGACTVTFPDLPEAITCGRDVDDAVNQAADCLQEALAGRMVRREAIPLPSTPPAGAAGGRRCSVPGSEARSLPGDAEKGGQQQ